MKTVVTHSGGFHADDVFAVAVFQLLLDKDNMTVVRTRDDEVISDADYVVDIGGIYDHELKRYDHHQPGAPIRENGIPYAAFGLVWKHYGEEVAGSKEAAEKIEEKICVPVDASDNAINIWDTGQFELAPLEWDDILQSWRAEDTASESMDEQFLHAVDFAREYLRRRIQRETVKLELSKKAKELYDSHHNDQIIISDEYVPQSEFIQYDHVNVIVFPRESEDQSSWVAIAVQIDKKDYATRVSFPESWGGLHHEELAKVSGIEDAIFCHKTRYLFIAKSKESAIQAAKLAK